ncbi:hypothetical protein C8R47DRAFT_762001 [Mycena vitilis]|nr:hypothetical protein C8R47DRAFT_762001 [Mycena vitilis]
MTTTRTVPLSALATSVEDIDATKLKRRFLLPNDDISLHRHMEYLWGLNIRTIDPTHERNIIRVRKSMTTFPNNFGWTLVPTEETLAAMDALQVHNFTVPISERKSFLTVRHAVPHRSKRSEISQEFSAKEYEYIFVPLYTEADFFILEPDRIPQRFSAPYTDFPLVTSTANPFFVTFDSQLKIRPDLRASTSESWYELFSDITIHWGPFPLPEDFLSTSCPATLVTPTDDASEPELHQEGPEWISGSDETVVTPADEILDKEVYICKWAQQTSLLHEPIKSPPLSPTPRSYRRRNQQKIIPYPRWRIESKRGKALSGRLVKPPHDVRRRISP